MVLEPVAVGDRPEDVALVEINRDKPRIRRLERVRQTARTDEPSAKSLTSGRIAFSPSVCGVKFGSAASGVSQLTRQASRDSRVTASRIADGSPRSNPSERTSTAAPRE